ncbi:MAG: M64 family metallopeptidase [Holdemanella porci]
MNASATEYLRKGDVNGDGVIDERDMEAIAEYLVGRPILNFNEEVADFNKDGKISVADIPAISKHLRNGGEKEYQQKILLMKLYDALKLNRWEGCIGWSWDDEKPLSEWSNVGLNGNGDIEQLYLTLNDSTYFPKNLEPIPSLKILDCQGRLHGHPIEFAAQHSNLETLILSFTDSFQVLDTLPVIPSLHSLTLMGDGLFGDPLKYILKHKELTDFGIMWAPNTSGEVPASIGEMNNLVGFRFQKTGYSGEIPKEIFNLPKLEMLAMCESNFSGQISSDISKLELHTLEINHNNLSGEILDYLCDMPLQWLDLRANNFTGTIPEKLTNIWDALEQYSILGFQLGWNQFHGVVPRKIMEHPAWKYLWAGIIDNNPNLSNITADILPAPEYNLVDLNGGMHSSDDYSKHNLTMIWQDGFAFNPFVEEWYNLYKDRGLELVYYVPGVPISDILNTQQQYSISYPIIENNATNTNLINGQTVYPTNTFASVELIDAEGKMVYASALTGGYIIIEDIDRIIRQYCDTLIDTMNYYISTDYSSDGKVDTLQMATEGCGINLVFMGDAFSDRQIADGTYAQCMQKAVDAFFSEEPYGSHKEYFNIFIVNVVSLTEGYAHGGQRLGTGFGYGTEVFGNDAACINYALRTVPEKEIDNSLIVVLMDSAYYAGTCYMYHPHKGDYSDGLSVAYFPLGTDSAMFCGLVAHEAGGHGFAKLGDEYFYEEVGAITQEVKKQLSPFVDSGWFKNIDFVGDSVEVKWSKYLYDSRYAGQGLGCYEGAQTYISGVWRPTDNSIMRFNVGGYNAPSRESIWYRIHKLANGDDWKYNHEEFVAYDMVNSTPSARKVQKISPQKQYAPLMPPVIVNYDWKQVMQRKVIPTKAQTDTRIKPVVALPMRHDTLNDNNDYSIYTQDFTTLAGIEDTLPISMQNSGDLICAVQFDMVLPSVVDVVNDEAGFPLISLNVNRQPLVEGTLLKIGWIHPDTLRVVVTGSNYGYCCFNQYEGTLLELPIIVDAATLEGYYPVYYLNTEMVGIGEMHYLDYVGSSIFVKEKEASNLGVVQEEMKPIKIFHNGCFYIIRNNIMYTMDGLIESDME